MVRRAVMLEAVKAVIDEAPKGGISMEEIEKATGYSHASVKHCCAKLRARGKMFTRCSGSFSRHFPTKERCDAEKDAFESQAFSLGEQNRRLLRLVADAPPDGVTHEELVVLSGLRLKQVQKMMQIHRGRGMVLWVSFGRSMRYYSTPADRDAAQADLAAIMAKQAASARERRKEADRQRSQERTAQAQAQARLLARKAEEELAKQRAKPVPEHVRREFQRQYGAQVKVTVWATNPVLINRFGPADPTKRLPGGFYDEWLAKRGAA